MVIHGEMRPIKYVICGKKYRDFHEGVVIYLCSIVQRILLRGSASNAFVIQLYHDIPASRFLTSSFTKFTAKIFIPRYKAHKYDDNTRAEKPLWNGIILGVP